MAKAAEQVRLLNGMPLIEVAKRIWAEVRADDVFGRSAQLAYYFFLALFPFLICVIASLSVFGSADRGRMLLFAVLARFLPAPAFQLISSTFSQIIESGGPLKMSIGILVSLWSASMGMSALIDTLNAAYRVKESRSLMKQYAIAIALTIVVTVLLVISIVTGLLGDRIALHFYGGIWLVWRILEWSLALGVLFLALSILYYFAPDLPRRRWHWFTPGAMVAVLLLLAVSAGLRTYLHFAGSFGLAYGSLGAVIVLLLCFYFSGMALLMGGVLNAVLEPLARGNKALQAQAPNS
jgi:membrane protein